MTSPVSDRDAVAETLWRADGYERHTAAPGVVDDYLARADAVLALGFTRQPPPAAPDLDPLMLLHEIWLGIHVRRFDAREGGPRPDLPDEEPRRRRPNMHYAGIQQAEQFVIEVAARHGFGWREVQTPNAATQ